MSMQTYITYGYGVDLNANRIEFSAVMDFFEKHLPEEYESMLRDAEWDNIDTENLNDDNEEFADWVSEYVMDKYTGTADTTYYALIAYIITKETEIFVEEDHSEYGHAILFHQGYPWNENETEKELTEDKLRSIFKEYFAELGVDVDPDYVQVEYLC